MKQLKVKRLHPDAEMPSYAHDGDAGLDITCIDSGRWDDNSCFVEYKTGLAVEIPQGYVGLLFPRSSISKTCHILANSVGVIDSSYRGEITFRFRFATASNQSFYEKGDRIGQLVIVKTPRVEVFEVGELAGTKRGSGAYGSSGR